jgi:hypothetical protein
MSGTSSSNPDSALPEPLVFTVHDMPRPAALPDEQRRTRAGRLRMLLVLAICAAPVLASYLTYFVIRPQGGASTAELIEPRAVPPALPLSTLDGTAVDTASLRGQWLLLVVGSGACDAACERRLYLQRQLREMTGRERERIDKVWLVDDAAPLRPELLAALTATPAVTVLRAPREALQRWLAAAPGRALDEHLYIVDPMGQWMMRAPVDPDPQKLKRDVDRLLRASASWDRAGR